MWTAGQRADCKWPRFTRKIYRFANDITAFLGCPTNLRTAAVPVERGFRLAVVTAGVRPDRIADHQNPWHIAGRGPGSRGTGSCAARKVEHRLEQRRLVELQQHANGGEAPGLGLSDGRGNAA